MREVLANFCYDLDVQVSINLNILLYFCSFIQTMYRNIAMFIRFLENFPLKIQKITSFFFVYCF
jgi:hypothetical protein